MPDTALVFWVVLDLFLATLLLLVVGGAVVLHRAGPRPAGRARQRQAPSGISLALYASGVALGLALPLAATLVQTFRVLGVLPQQVPVATARRVLPLLLAAVVLCALSLTLGVWLEWGAGRRSSAG